MLRRTTEVREMFDTAPMRGAWNCCTAIHQRKPGNQG